MNDCKMGIKVEIPEALNKKIVEILEKQDLEVYIDRNDELSDSQINKMVSGKRDEVYEEILDCFLDCTYDIEIEGVKEMWNELTDEEKLSLCDPADEIEDVDEIDEEEMFRDLRDEYLDFLCVDIPIKDLIRNSGDPILFYSTGIETNGYGYFDEDVRELKKFLKIKMRDATYDKELKELVGNASYGGTLCIAFRPDLNDWMDIINAKDKPNKIIFRDPMLVIPNHSNGSGHNVEVGGLKIELPFIMDNCYCDTAVSYSYTDDVCGMSHDWCQCTDWELSTVKTRKKIERSKINDFMNREAELDAVFVKGGCTPGDMKYNRHRNVRYVNEFPCGSHCPKCGTFWID